MELISCAISSDEQWSTRQRCEPYNPNKRGGGAALILVSILVTE